MEMFEQTAGQAAADAAYWEERYEQCAEGLAGQGYAIVPAFLPGQEARNLLDHFVSLRQGENFRRAGIGSQEDFQFDSSIRGDLISWIEPSPASPVVANFVMRIRELMRYLNRSCFLGLKDVEMHFAVYPPGAQYQRHLDQFRQNDHRRISFICYLNPGWDPAFGGQLRLFLPEGERDVIPHLGTLACFRSDRIEHAVLPATQNRRSITGWMLDQDHRLTFL